MGLRSGARTPLVWTTLAHLEHMCYFDRTERMEGASRGGETMQATDIAQFTAALASADPEHLEHVSPGDLCDLITALQLAKNAAAAVQARATVAAADSLRAQAIADGVAAARADKGIPQQVGLA